MVVLGKEKAKTLRLQQLGALFRGQGNVDSQRLQHVGGAALGGGRAVAVLGDRNAAGGHHKGRGGGDIEGVGPVAAGADNLQRVQVVEQPDTVGAHGGGAGGDLIDGLPLHGQRGEEGGHLDRAGLAAHDLVHHGGGRVIGQVVLGGKLMNGFFNHDGFPPENGAGWRRPGASKWTRDGIAGRRRDSCGVPPP